MRLPHATALRAGVHLCMVVCFVALNIRTAEAESVPNAEWFGRWDLTVSNEGGFTAAWLEVVGGEREPYRGRLVWLFGGAEPIHSIYISEGRLRFGHRVMGRELEFSATMDGDRLEGGTIGDHVNLRWFGERAPALQRKMTTHWGDPVPLLKRKSLEGWRQRSAQGIICWSLSDGMLSVDSPCSDLITEATFSDFQLHLEFRLLDSGGSGVYLRGRYEIQIGDDAGLPPSVRTTGAIFGMIAPQKSMAKPIGEWQTLDATLIGRTVTVAINGETIISGAEIPGITGAAMDSHEDMPGPIMLQGDHGRVAFRNILIAQPQ